MLAKRDQWLHQAQHEIDAEAIKKHLATHLVEARIARRAIALPLAFQQLLMPIARFAASNLPSEHAVALLVDWKTPISATPETLPMWRALADLLLTATGEPRKEAGLNVKFGFPATEKAKRKNRRWQK